MRSILAGLTILVLATPLMAQEKQVIGAQAPTNPNAPPRPLSPAIRHNGVLWVSGQLGVAPARDSGAANDISAQTKRALENVKRLAEEGGSNMDLGLHCTVFLTNITDFQAMNAVYVTLFTKDRPTRSTVAVAALASPQALIEIECQFAMPGAK